MKKCFLIVRAFVLQVLFLIPAPLLCKPAHVNSGQVTIIIEPVFNNQPLKLTSKYYINEHGDTLYIDAFRFYISNISLGVDSAMENAHLFDAADSNSYRFAVSNIAGGNYTSLQFIAGVDSIANTSGANSGDLDPAKGMYWAWNSGYIMTKLEGRSKVCKTLHHAFEFHIGGYMPPYNAARVITLALPHTIEVNDSSHTVIRIKADVSAWFKGNPGLSQINDVVIPGKAACAIADNYAQMFSVE